MTETCDFLVIGGGVAGCIIAKRLAERTSGRIILVEAGKSDEGDPIANDLSRLGEQTAAMDWGFRAAPLSGGPALLNYPRAKILGGCANHNDCAFLVPPPSDFEAWERHGAAGWGPMGVAMYFGRVDEQVATTVVKSGNPVSQAFVDAGKELGLEDVDFRARIEPGVGWFPLNAKGALRQATSVAYLHPLSSLPKHLDVFTETFISKLMVENSVAIGAETSRGRIIASKQVILTAGAINTPQLLLLSGIGPATELSQFGIPVVADLPGVGKHLLDHVAAPVVLDLARPIPPWKLTPFEATMLVAVEDGQPAPDVLFHFGLRVREKYGDAPRLGQPRNGVKISPNVARSRSEGSVTLRSPDSHDAPAIDLNYLSDPEGYDRRVLLKAIRLSRQIGKTAPFQKLGAVEAAPGPNVQSDDELMAFILSVCETVYHCAGTARMGDPSDRRTVVDPQLRVKGIRNLRVADASVFPSMVTVNIANTVMMVAEKAVDLILVETS